LNEKPLSICDNQKHVYYDKGLINLYAFQSQIGEALMNRTIKSFYDYWSDIDILKKEGRYANSNDLIQCLKQTLPDSLSYIANDLFNRVVLFDNELSNVSIENSLRTFIVDFDLLMEKIEMDSLGGVNSIDEKQHIDLGFYLRDNFGIDSLIQLIELPVVNGVNSFKYNLDFQPSKIVIDPRYKLLDNNLNDNIFEFTYE